MMVATIGMAALSRAEDSADIGTVAEATNAVPGYEASASDVSGVTVKSNAAFASDAKLNSHFVDHGGDIQASTAIQYESSAKSFLTEDLPPGVMQKVRANGDIVRYDPSTRMYGVITKDNVIRTYFKLDDKYNGVQYFNDK